MRERFGHCKEADRKEKEEVRVNNLSLEESLQALKDCKRAVEIRYKNIITENSDLSQKVETLQQEKILLESQCSILNVGLNKLENEKAEQTEIMAELQQNLIIKTSEYDSQIRNMQIELGKRLDEINDVQKEDVDKVKGHYIELFHEKASEVNTLRDELEQLNNSIVDYKSKVKDLEYREEELNNIVNKMREGKLGQDQNIELNQKIDTSYSNTQLLEAKIKIINEKFLNLQENNSNQLLKLDFHILELEKVIRDRDLEIDALKENDYESKESNLKSTDAFTVNSSQVTSQSKPCEMVRPRNKRKKKKTKPTN